MAIAKLLVIAYDDFHRPRHLGAPELPPEGAMCAEQTHERPARISNDDPARTHGPPDAQHEVAVSRLPGRHDLLALHRYESGHG